MYVTSYKHIYNLLWNTIYQYAFHIFLYSFAVTCPFTTDEPGNIPFLKWYRVKLYCLSLFLVSDIILWFFEVFFISLASASSLGLIIAIVVVLLLLIIAVIVGFILYKKFKGQHKTMHQTLRENQGNGTCLAACKPFTIQRSQTLMEHKSRLNFPIRFI